MLSRKKTDSHKRAKKIRFPRRIRTDKLLGPSYKLNHKEYFLPLPSQLQPRIDSKAGELELWPVYAGSIDRSSACHAFLNKQLVLLPIDKTKSELFPMPIFLRKLNEFVKKELLALNCTEVKPCELRLQVYKKVFDSLIENLKTHSFLLATIKNEYEMMLDHQEQQLQKLKPLPEALYKLSKEPEPRRLRYLVAEREDIEILRCINREQSDMMAGLVEDKKSLKKEVEELQEKLKEEYHRYRDAHDARRLLVPVVVGLRYPKNKMFSQLAELDSNPIIRKSVRECKQKMGF